MLLTSGAPAARAQVRLFDLADLRSAPIDAAADESGYFALPLATLAGLRPERFELGSNFPNPFNPSTIIPYQLPAPTRVRLEVFNLLGQRISTLVDGEQPAGFHAAQWDATDAAGQAVGAGVYLYRLSGDGAKITRRMLLIDGQAGIPSGAGGTSGLGGESDAGEDRETPVYGLTVSGPGLVPYVDPAFRVEAGRAPLDLVIEAPGRVPPAKVAAGGILGDVDNTGGVDFFDALLVALYSQDSRIVMPNNGDISLGDVDADGQVDLSDAWAIAAWLNDPSDPSLPSGIGEAVGPAASLGPDPATVTFADDGVWHRFTVQAGEPVSVVVNPAGTPRGLEITTRSGRGNFCPAEADDDVSRRDGQTLYLSGCAAGEATVELRRESDGTVLRTYILEVTGSPADLIVTSVSVSDSSLTPGQSFTLRATVRNQGTSPSAATTLQYYRSSNRTISTRDVLLGTDALGNLAVSRIRNESISLLAPSTPGTYYYGACVASVSGESDTPNNCSTGVRVIVEGDSPDLTRLSWPPEHMTSIWWHWYRASGPSNKRHKIRELEIDFTIHNDPGDFSDKHGLYLMLCYSVLSDVAFYFGLQTDVVDLNHVNGRRGKSLVFSRWGTRDLANAQVADAAEGWTQSSGHEGDFIGVRRTYDWGVGDYRVRFAPDGSEADGEWFGVWITDKARDETTWIGSLKFPYLNGEAALSWSSMYTTVEIYGYGSPIRPIDIPEWHVSVKRPSGDGVKPVASTSHYSPEGLFSRKDSPKILNSNVRYDLTDDAMHFQVGGSTERTNPEQRTTFD